MASLSRSPPSPLTHLCGRQPVLLRHADVALSIPIVRAMVIYRARALVHHAHVVLASIALVAVGHAVHATAFGRGSKVRVEAVGW